MDDLAFDAVHDARFLGGVREQPGHAAVVAEDARRPEQPAEDERQDQDQHDRPPEGRAGVGAGFVSGAVIVGSERGAAIIGALLRPPARGAGGKRAGGSGSGLAQRPRRCAGASSRRASADSVSVITR